MSLGGRSHLCPYFAETFLGYIPVFPEPLTDLLRPPPPFLFTVFLFLIFLLTRRSFVTSKRVAVQRARLHVPRPAGGGLVELDHAEPANLFALMDLMKRSALRSRSFNSSSTTTPRTRRSGGNPTCALFPSAEVQSFVQSSAPPPPFTILTVGCDPANVIQMSCIMGPAALTEDGCEHCPLYGDGGSGNNGFSDGGCWNKEPLPPTHLQSSAAGPVGREKPSEVL